MVNETASKQAVPFFPDVPLPKKTDAADFKASLNQALNAKDEESGSEPAVTRTRSDRVGSDKPGTERVGSDKLEKREDSNVNDWSSSPRRVDKPKVMNREPFFPKQPVPYHPEPRVVAEDPSLAGPEVMMLDSSNSLDEAPEIPDVPLGYDLGDDDMDGILAQSYSSAAAIYPMSRIGSEAVPDQTQKELSEQGLWNTPPMVMAHPTPRMQLMGEFVAKGDEKPEVLPLSKPVARFMASMESELGVTRNKIVQAFEALPAGELSKTPEATLNQVVKGLGLSAQDEAVAKELYTQMIQELKEQGDQSENVAFDDVSPQSPVPAKSVLAATAAYQRREPATQEVLPRSNSKDSGFKTAAAADKNTVSPLESASAVKAPAASPESAPPSIDLSSGQMPQAPTEMDRFVANEKPSSDKESLFEKKGSLKDAKVESKSPDVSPVPFDIAKPAAPITAAGETVLQGQAATGTEKHEAIRDIVNQAQTLATKGGGEVQMTLRPDHLGEIQLKVVVDNGRVDVQMMADKQETKKLLDQNIHELKHSLATHNLSVDRLDVGLQDKNTAQFQQQRFDQQSARDFAMHYQSQNQNQSGRNRSEESPWGRNPNVQKFVKANPAGSSVRAGSSSGRLNIVA